MSLELLKQEIAGLRRDIDCIKTGDCCGGANANIYTDSGTIGAGRQATLTDTLSILSSGSVLLNRFNDDGNVNLSLNTGFTSIGLDTPDSKLHIRGNDALYTGGLIKTENNLGERVLTLKNNGQFNLGINEEPLDALQGLFAFDVRITSNAADKFNAGFYFKGTDIEGPVVRILGDGDSHLGLRVSNTTTQNTVPIYGADISSGKSGVGISSNNYVGTRSKASEVGLLNTIGVTGYFQAENIGLYYDSKNIFGIRGISAYLNNTGINSIHIGGDFVAGTTTDISDGTVNTFIGVAGETIARGGVATIIGGVFRTRDVSPLPNANLTHIALLVPDTNNDGIVVMGSDTISGNNRAFLEVTGNIEIFGIGRGVIVNDLFDGNKYRITTSGGSVVANIV